MRYLISQLTIILMLCGCSTTESQKQLAAGSGFIEVPGGPVWYDVMAGGEGVPLLTIHGGPGSTSCGMQALAALDDDRPVIRYDQLGTGRSGRPTDQSLWDRDRFVEELSAIRQELGLEKVHLLGHSWGASLAAYYVLETGGQGVQSLILSSPLISTEVWIADAILLRKTLPPEVQQVLDENEAAGTFDSPEYKEATAVFYDLFVTRGDPVERFDCSDAPGNSLIYNQMWGPTEFLSTGSLVDFDLRPRLGQISVPTLFLTGEHDEARPETISQFVSQVPDAKFEVVPGVAHASLTRAPDVYRRHVRNFLRGVERTDAP
ncbi:MAG: proline iminopeptidase-family hydrolase [Pseudomonadota bacterium]